MFGEIAPKTGGGAKPLVSNSNTQNPVPQVGGINSIVSGPGAVAIGDGAIAFGAKTKAVGFDATSMGRGAVATGQSLALGVGSIASNASIAIGTNGSTSATGSQSLAIGAYGNIASSTGCIAIGGAAATAAQQGSMIFGGYFTSTEFAGEICFHNGGFAFPGNDIHTSFIRMWMQTANATPTEIKTGQGADTTAPTGVIVLTNASTYLFDVDIVARKSPSGVDYSAWNLKFCINREANAASTALVGSVKTLIAQTSGASTWDINVTADTTNGRPNISLTGQAATTIRWVGFAKMVKVGL